MAPVIVLALIVAAALLLSTLGPGARWRFGGRTAKRCSRCWKNADRLVPYVDGRRDFWVCPMCAAEMDFTNASHIDLPRN